jgi:hypothetical protein
VFDSGQAAPDEEESASSERREQVKRVVSRIDPQWADLFDRAAAAINQSRGLQRKLSEVLAIAARFVARKH